MKKFAPIVALVVFGTLFTSCKKEWDCECTTTTGGTSTSVTAKTAKLSKKDAEAACNTGDVTVGSTTVACEIK